MRQMLKKALKIERVHVSGDTSLSKLNEWFTWLAEFTTPINHNTPQPVTLVAVISIAMKVTYLEDRDRDKYKTYRHWYGVPPWTKKAVDNTQLY